MDVFDVCCCRIDVHAKRLVACLIKKGTKEIRSFSNMPDDGRRLLEWSILEGCTSMAIESTGVSWKSVFNIFERAMDVILVTAWEAKGVLFSLL